MLSTVSFAVKAALMVSERKRHDLQIQLEGLKQGWKALGLKSGESIPLFGITAGKTEIQKSFEVGSSENQKFYTGIVKTIWAFRPRIRKGAEIMAHVVYEDGDSEDLNLRELRDIIESNVETGKMSRFCFVVNRHCGGRAFLITERSSHTFLMIPSDINLISS